ncbi:GTP cyclohydrolase II [Ephemerocybe angulata]|uniref:GTP cyclohydrolase II n=1 Tax=Ephemerocybe angulata TaxID=980116 RepID=A0A8H6IAE0_9AGAR|nr:GTP cyclohydrolase II [Tulosesus angulatus]
MGQKSSKQKNPWGAQPYGYPPNPYGGAPPFLPPGYQPTPGPFPMTAPGQPGFIPPGTYGQGGMSMPQPQLAFMPQDKGTKKDRKGKRRAQSEQYPGGFAGSGMGLTFPQPNIPSNAPVIPPEPPRKSKSTRRRASTSNAPPPLTTPKGTRVPLTNFPVPSRTGTPFIPRSRPGADESYSDETSTDSDEDEDEDRQRSFSAGGSRRRRSSDPRRTQSASAHGHFPPEITGRIDDVLRPLSPAHRSAFGPSGSRPTEPIRNPLPPPPRDLYEMTPYKSLLTLPQTTALLTATYGTAQQQNASASGGHANGAATTLVIPPAGHGPAAIIPPEAQQPQPLKKTPSQKKKGRVSGIMRALSGRRKKEDKQGVAPPGAIVAQPAKVQFVPVFVDGQKKPGTSIAPSTHNNENQGNQGNLGNLGTASASADNSALLSTESHQEAPRRHSIASSHHPPPAPPHEAEDDAIRFDQMNQQYAGFMNHSPHRVLYQNKMYPTATHLHEAMKYLPDHPIIAEQIRNTASVLEVYPLSAQFNQYVREDWSDVFMQKMEEVLRLKFAQHADLRETLVRGTGERKLIYADVLDVFWGVGPQGDGANELGHVLMQVRDWLRVEGGLR